MISSLSLLFKRDIIFRLKNGSSRQSFLMPQSYTWCRNLHVESLVLQSKMCWFILILNPFVLFQFVLPIYIFFSLHISNNRWHWLSGSQFLCEFLKLVHLTLWIYQFHLNNFDIFYIFCHCIFKSLVF